MIDVSRNLIFGIREWKPTNEEFQCLIHLIGTISVDDRNCQPNTRQQMAQIRGIIFEIAYQTFLHRLGWSQEKAQKRLHELQKILDLTQDVRSKRRHALRCLWQRRPLMAEQMITPVVRAMLENTNTSYPEETQRQISICILNSLN